MKENRAFTLIELLIVVAIIGILAAISIPTYVGMRARAVRSEAYANVEALVLLEEQFYAENAAYTASAAGTAAIQVLLPGFQPGQSITFTYQVVQNFAVDLPITEPPTWGTGQTPCFTAVATGAAGSVTGEVFAMDCNNNKNF